MEHLVTLIVEQAMLEYGIKVLKSSSVEVVPTKDIAEKAAKEILANHSVKL